jgi:hypothetical protein
MPSGRAVERDPKTAEAAPARTGAASNAPPTHGDDAYMSPEGRNVKEKPTGKAGLALADEVIE